MDDWSNNYLDEWWKDFHDEPDAQQCFDFLKEVFLSLNTISADVTSQLHAASTISASFQAQTNQQSLSQCLQAVLLEAASISLVEPEDLANVTLLFIDQSPKLAGRFQYDFVLSMQQKWNGPEMPESDSERDIRIQQWVKLNAYAAYLTRSDACPLEGYALRTFNMAFPQEGIKPDRTELNYHVPAAAVWIQVLGREIYAWSRTDSSHPERLEQSLFSREKWQAWRNSFGHCSRDDGLQRNTNLAAEDAYQRMKAIENF